MYPKELVLFMVALKVHSIRTLSILLSLMLLTVTLSRITRGTDLEVASLNNVRALIAEVISGKHPLTGLQIIRHMSQATLISVFLTHLEDNLQVLIHLTL